MISCTFENGNQAALRHLVADILILKGNKVLLVKRTAKLQEGGKWGLPGGFLERDETLYEGIQREALEETGWELKDIILFRINDSPNRPHEGHRQNVDCIFVSTARKKVGEADWESDEQKWFPLTDLPPDNQIAFDHADSLHMYKSYLDKHFELPVIGLKK